VFDAAVFPVNNDGRNRAASTVNATPLNADTALSRTVGAACTPLVCTTTPPDDTVFDDTTVEPVSVSLHTESAGQLRQVRVGV
jgi:hypothetical protein